MKFPSAPLALGSLIAFSATLGACKKKEPPPPPPPAPAAVKAPPAPPLPDISCPDPGHFAPFLAEAEAAAPPAPAAPEAAGKKAPKKKKAGKPSARVLRTDCVVFAPGRFWLAAALSYDEKTGKSPRLGLLSGSPTGKTMIFDVQPLPSEVIEKLMAESPETGVKIRKTRDDKSLVRLGIVGGPGGGKPDQQEIGFLLQLVAHQPPKMVWSGPGDKVETAANGCVTEQVVDFELLFRTRLERFTMGRVRPDASGKTPPNCEVGPSMQDSLGFKPMPLQAGRIFAEATVDSAPAAAPPPKSAPAAPPH